MEPSKVFKERELEGLYLQLSDEDRNIILWNARWKYIRHQTIKKIEKISQPLRLGREPRQAHWIQSQPRRPRSYERQMFWLLVVTAIVMSRPETIKFNVMIGAALSFGFMLYVLIKMLFSSENE